MIETFELFESQQQFMFPNIVNICVLRGVCPCRCVHCPVGKTPLKERSMKFGKAHVPLSLFKKIAAEMSEFPHTTLRIHAVGDPILWRYLPHALRFTRKNNVRTWLFTSLVTNDISLLETLAHHTDIIEISLNSYDQENYKKTKGIDAFSRVKQGIEFLHTTCRDKKFSTRVIVSRVQSEDKAYDDAFVHYWKETRLVADAFIRSYHDYNTLLENKFGMEQREIVPCLVHWSRFNIDSDGSAVICFNELFKGKHADQSLILGNTREQTIAEIWQGEKLNQVRRAQLAKDYSLVDFTSRLPCKGCLSCQSMTEKKRPTSEYQVRMLTGENHG
jgi:MoaA/NifB/PqqE/SkfB family radical SAM enzyme